MPTYRGADKSLARPTSRCILFDCENISLVRPTSRCILFDGENISFDASLVIYLFIYIYINSTNIPPIMIVHVNRIYELQDLLSL